MLFNSLSFLIFFLIVVVAYWALPHRGRWVLLLVASYFFYAAWNPAYILLLAGITAIAYFSSLWMDRAKGKERKTALIVGIVLSFSVLVYFKYLDFLGQSANGLFALMGFDLNIPIFNIMLPIGISFQTFQNVGYLVDAYKNKVPVEKNIFRFALFVSYFPQLVAGPIERAANLMPQLKEVHHFSSYDTTYGLRLMLLGFFKKIVIADTVSVYVDTVYGALPSSGVDTPFVGLSLIVATVLFAFQIYCDFSGYSDIAIGASKVLGIDLMTNFKSPYLSRNPQEFWRRWHISLSSWFADYVYIPLGGSRVKVPRYLLNLFITFTISGLWHGADWTFVIWGAYHGILVAGYVLLRKLRTRPQSRTVTHRFAEPKPKPKSNVKIVLSVIATFILMNIGWVFFRADTLQDALYVLTSSFEGWTWSYRYFANQLVNMGFSKLSLALTIVMLAALFVIDWINYREPVTQVLSRQKMPVRWALYFALTFAIIAAFMITADSQNFIYFQF